MTLHYTVNDTNHFRTRVLSIHESSWNNIRSQQLVPLAEFLEDDPVRESLATDADSFQDSIASQLLQHQMTVYLAGLSSTAVRRIANMFIYPQRQHQTDMQRRQSSTSSLPSTIHQQASDDVAGRRTISSLVCL